MPVYSDTFCTFQFTYPFILSLFPHSPSSPSTYPYHTTFLPPCQHTTYIINKTLTILPSFPLIQSIQSIVPYSKNPFLKWLHDEVGFFIWEPSGSINEKRFDGDPNEVRGRGEKTESLFGEGGYGNHGFPIYKGYNRFNNPRLRYNKTYVTYPIISNEQEKRNKRISDIWFRGIN